jgi:uncharacterized protein with von Willebrand factor type A (vWA) domain
MFKQFLKLVFKQSSQQKAHSPVPKMVKNGHNSPFGSLASLLSPLSVHALEPDLNARKGFLAI